MKIYMACLLHRVTINQRPTPVHLRKRVVKTEAAMVSDGVLLNPTRRRAKWSYKPRGMHPRSPCHWCTAAIPRQWHGRLSSQPTRNKTWTANIKRVVMTADWRWITDVSQSGGPDSRPRLEGARYKYLTSCLRRLSPPYPTVTHTLAYIINRKLLPSQG